MLAHILAQAQAIVAQLGAPMVSAIAAFIIEGIAKLWPTANPQGWLIWADKGLKKLSAVAVEAAQAIAQVGDLLVKIDAAIVALIPQNIAPKK